MRGRGYTLYLRSPPKPDSPSTLDIVRSETSGCSSEMGLCMGLYRSCIGLTYSTCGGYLPALRRE